MGGPNLKGNNPASWSWRGCSKIRTSVPIGGDQGLCLPMMHPNQSGERSWEVMTPGQDEGQGPF